MYRLQYIYTHTHTHLHNIEICTFPPQILDTNKDGKISESEFGCASKAPFKKLDVDCGKKKMLTKINCASRVPFKKLVVDGGEKSQKLVPKFVSVLVFVQQLTSKSSTGMAVKILISHICKYVLY